MRGIGFFLLALACGPALGEWVEIVGTDDEVGTFFIDPATLQRFGDGMRWAWLMQDLKKAAEDGFLSYAGLFEFDCAKQRTRPIQTYFYAGHRTSGEVVKKTGDSTNWTQALADTPAGRTLKFACAN